MKNKAYFIRRLADLKGLDPNSEEVQSWSDRKILDLMVETKMVRDQKREERIKGEALGTGALEAEGTKSFALETEDFDVSVMSRVRGF